MDKIKKKGEKKCIKSNRGATWQMNALHWIILDLLRGLMKHFGKSYCYPSQKKIVELLWKQHGVKISRRTLNRYLDDLERWNCISRIRRLRKGPDGEIQFFTTAYYILQRVVDNVKKIVRAVVRVAGACRVPLVSQYSLTTQRDFSKTSESDGGTVPLDWIKDFRKQLSAA